MTKQVNVWVFLLVLTVSFSCEQEYVPATKTVKLMASVTYTIGGVVYKSAQVPVTISGFDESGTKGWSEDFTISSPATELTVELGFHHYVIESNQWSIHVEKRISADELWAGRVGGPTPAVYELAGSSPATRRLAHYIEYYEDAEAGFVAQQKVRYLYNETGKLLKYTVYGYNEYKALVEQQHYDFVYENNVLSTITGYFTGNSNPFVKYTYTYGSGSGISKIKQANFQAGVNSEVNFEYDNSGDNVRANYSFSNGESFVYEFSLADGNVAEDKTINASGLCNAGYFTYDNKINPFSLLGYTDFNLTNLSVNNRLAEEVSYVACAFPTLVPQSYAYVYDEAGYPLVATTTYVPNASGKSLRSKRTFIYE